MKSLKLNMNSVRNLKWLWITIFVFIVDQWTKHLVLQHLTLLQSQHVTDFFNLTLAHNAGAAFSFLSSSSGWQRWFFIGVSTTLSIAIFIWMLRTNVKNKWLLIALALVLGGAVGNLWDRVTLGYVIDFIDLYIQHWHWPVFNLADSAISMGVVMLIIDMMFIRSDH